jgi:hypothetical protein
MNPEPSDIAADALGRWLAAREPGGWLRSPPIDLDLEVVEAVFALRPDLAPPASTSAEDVLRTLDGAARLERWLDGGSADGVDLDVRASVFAMAPHRAPAAALTADDLVAALRGGPKLAKFLNEVASDGEDSDAWNDVTDDDLDDDVAEALFAIRPDLAPPPTVRIEDILATLDEAPRLARALDRAAPAPASAAAEGIFAIRPDLAPAPTVQLDDILARVTSGPLAAPVAAIPHTEAANQPVRRPRNWFAALLLAGGGGTAALLAAAATLLLVIRFDSAESAAPPFAPPAAEAPTVAGVSEGGAAAPAEDAAVSAEDAAVSAEDAPAYSAAVPASTKERQLAKHEVDARARGDAAPATRAPAAAPESAIAEAEGPPPPPPAPPTRALDDTLGLTGGSDVVAYGLGGVGTSEVASGFGAGGKRAEAKPAAAPVASAAPSKAKVDAREEGNPARTAAWSRSVPSPDASREDAETRSAIAYAEAEAARDARVRQWSQAGDAMARVVAVPTASIGVAQWYAAKAGEYYLQAGDPTAALAILDRAISLGRSPQLPAALRVQGDALDRVGQARRASDAWSNAAR